LGEIIYSEPLVNTGSTLEKEINLGQLSPGMYLLSLEGERENHTRKIIVN
jgi:hypothetical protein